MRLFISVISHRHFDVISTLNCLPYLASLPFVDVVVRDNVGEKALECYCKQYDIHYVLSEPPCGFGGNNNAVFRYCRDSLGMVADDMFLLMNPDISISHEMLVWLYDYVVRYRPEFATGRLFLDEQFQKPDQSIRRLPVFSDFVKSYLLPGYCYSLDFDALEDGQELECCTGAFMLFLASHYEKLDGFDERYYMYCEDFDICRRSAQLGVPLIYISDLKVCHFKRGASRKFLSWHFWLHVKSILRYSFLS